MIVAFIPFSSLFMWILPFYHRSELSYGITKYIKMLFINDQDFQFLLQISRLRKPLMDLANGQALLTNGGFFTNLTAKERLYQPHLF